MDDAGGRYVDLARRVIVELLDEEHAVVWNEVEAKLSDRRWPTLPPQVHRIDPHHLTAARAQLADEGIIVRDERPTRGGARVAVWTPGDTRRRSRAITDASGRKRLLEVRYLGWATGGGATPGPGVIGPAGEAVVHASLLDAAPDGYQLVNRQNGQVTTLYGLPVPGGPLDNAAFYSQHDPVGTPTGVIFDVLVEVKNIRGWIYPSTAELYQLLHKAAELQVVHPDRNYIPVLFCRRAHYLTTTMAEQLGFYVVQMKRQYAPPSLRTTDSRLFDEVQSELGYDLDATAGANTAQVRHLTHTIPSVANRTASEWKVTAPAMMASFRFLRDKEVDQRSRMAVFSRLAETAVTAHGGQAQRWHTV